MNLLEPDELLTRNMAYTPVIHRPSLCDCEGNGYGGKGIETDLSRDIVNAGNGKVGVQLCTRSSSTCQCIRNLCPRLGFQPRDQLPM